MKQQFSSNPRTEAKISSSPQIGGEAACLSITIAIRRAEQKMNRLFGPEEPAVGLGGQWGLGED